MDSCQGVSASSSACPSYLAVAFLDPPLVGIHPSLAGIPMAAVVAAAATLPSFMRTGSNSAESRTDWPELAAVGLARLAARSKNRSARRAYHRRGTGCLMRQEAGCLARIHLPVGHLFTDLLLGQGRCLRIHQASHLPHCPTSRQLVVLNSAQVSLRN